MLTLTLHSQFGRHVQLANATNQTKSSSNLKTYDYKSLLGFTPKVPAKPPTGLNVYYTSATVDLYPTGYENTFVVDYGAKMKITERLSKGGYLSFPPAKYFKKITGEGSTIYQIAPFDWSKNPEQEDMVLKYQGVVYDLTLFSSGISAQECIQLLRNLVPYKQKPMGVLKEYTGVSEALVKKVLSSRFILPQSVPKRYRLFLVNAQQGTGVDDQGHRMNTGELRLGYSKDTGNRHSMDAPGSIVIDEKLGNSIASLGFVGQESKIGSLMVYQKDNEIGWYDPTTKILTSISGGSQVRKATVISIAKAMILKTR